MPAMTLIMTASMTATECVWIQHLVQHVVNSELMPQNSKYEEKTLEMENQMKNLRIFCIYKYILCNFHKKYKQNYMIFSGNIEFVW